MQTYSCKKCSSPDLYIKENGSQTGLYCGDCGTWQKWINKEEKRLIERYIENKTSFNSIVKEFDYKSFKSDIEKWKLDIEEMLKSNPYDMTNLCVNEVLGTVLELIHENTICE